MISVGIDPGLSGALVATDGSSVLYYADTPTLQLAPGKAKRDYDVQGIRSLFVDLWTALNITRDDDYCVFIEHQQPMPFKRKGKDGKPIMIGSSQAMFGMGLGYGLWLGFLGDQCTNYETVRPATWQKAMLAGIPGEGKVRSLLRCAQAFPGLPLTKPKGRKPVMDGRADAALIALWGLRRMRGER